MGRRGSLFSNMTRNELLAYCKNLYDENGIEALSYPQLKTIKGLYHNLYSKGINQKKPFGRIGIARRI